MPAPRSTTGARRALRLALRLAVALSLSTVAGPGASAAVRRTAVTMINPVHADSHLIKRGYHVAHTRSSGDCQDSNIVPGAGRCFSGNYVYDPCWPFRYRNSDYSGYACLAAPWSKSLTVLRNASSDKSRTRGRYIWGVQLANGARCSLATGAGDQYHGEFYSFYCSKGYRLLGFPNRKHPLWTIRAVHKVHGSNHLSRVSLTRAWFGVGQEGA